MLGLCWVFFCGVVGFFFFPLIFLNVVLYMQNKSRKALLKLNFLLLLIWKVTWGLQGLG